MSVTIRLHTAADDIHACVRIYVCVHMCMHMHHMCMRLVYGCTLLLMTMYNPHTHTHTHKCIYICMSMCVACAYEFSLRLHPAVDGYLTAVDVHGTANRHMYQWGEWCTPCLNL